MVVASYRIVETVWRGKNGNGERGRSLLVGPAIRYAFRFEISVKYGVRCAMGVCASRCFNNMQ